MTRILIVDDEPAILAVLEGILASPDRSILLAETAEQALRAGRDAEGLDVAIVDKNLPDRTGLEVTRELKHLHPEVEIIVLTGHVSVDSAIEAVRVGAFDYVPKPITDFDAFTRKVQSASDKVRLKRGQRKVLDRYAESEERYRGVFQGCADAMVVCDPETGAVQDANRAAEELYGWTAEELRALSQKDLLAAEDGAAPPGGDTEKHRRKDGSVFSAEVRRGEFLYRRRPAVVLSVRDVTARERLEQERRALEEGLRQAQKMDAMGRLAGGLAHDFNNLLTVILSNAEILEEVADGEGARERSREIAEAAERAAALTRHLLSFSRKKPTRLESLDLNAVVADMLRLLRRLIGEDIEILAEPAAGLWRARADADQLGQVLLNLAANARDAMPEGGRLWIQAANVTLDGSALGQGPGELEPGRWVRLSVRDEGCGMSRETLARSFEPFFTTKQPGKGTGLGLSSVSAIAAGLGGAVRAHSEEGKGTTIEVYLPVAETESERAARLAAAPPPHGRGETVLVVEDDDAVRALAGRTLTAHGYRVLQGRDGRHALDVASAHEGAIDLLVTDVVMPGIRGWELAESLRRERPGMAVLMISAHGEPAPPEAGQAARPTAYLPKPFTERLLLGRVAEALGRTWTGAA